MLGFLSSGISCHFIGLSCYNRIPNLDDLSNIYLFLTVLEAGHPRSGWADLVSSEDSFSGFQMATFLLCLLCVCVCARVCVKSENSLVSLLTRTQTLSNLGLNL